MSESPAGPFIASIIGPAGHPVGVGTLVGAREVITCAQVVNLALGRDPRAQDTPTSRVRLRFPHLADTLLEAEVRMWVAPPTRTAAGDDLAGLALLDDPAVNSLEVRPARLAVNPPPVGRLVQIFGPSGGATAVQIFARPANGRLRFEPAPADGSGFLGGPLYDDSSGMVVGLVSAAPPRVSDEGTGHALAADRLRLAWPEVLDQRALSRARGTSGGTRLTILHVSDPQFGQNHLFGGNGLTPADQAHDTLHGRLHQDLEALAEEHGLRPDLLVVTGDLAESGLASEFERAFAFIGALADAVEVPRRHVVIVPGNHDVNRFACQGYFASQEGAEQKPVPPYFPKWTQFLAAFTAFYSGMDGVTFTPDEPWSLFAMPDLKVVVAGLNSTMAESHRDEDHYGHVGEAQLRWFASRLAEYSSLGWLRLAAVHHNAVRGAVNDDENLRDADDLDRILGEPGLVNLLLHGHTHDGRRQQLSSGLMVLCTGSAAVSPEAHPGEVPNQYQLITIDRTSVTRHARRYKPRQRRWIADTGISRSGSEWHDRQACEFYQVDAVFPARPIDLDRSRMAEAVLAARVTLRELRDRDDLLTRVEEATRVSHPQATVTARPDPGYLRVSAPLPGGTGAALWPVGVIEGAATEEAVDFFINGVHAQFAAADPTVRSQLVHGGPPVPVDLVAHARAHGVRLRSFVDYQGLLDLRPLVDRQTERLVADRIYPPALYVPQRYRLIGPYADEEVDDDVAARVTGWLADDAARLVMVLGDFGRGKTALLRQLARTVRSALPDLWPVLVELRALEKAPSLDELLSQHLIRHQVEDFNSAKLRYMIQSGRLALLFDGFDELELRVGYDSAADYLQTLLESVTEQAKVVLTSRTQHFHSVHQVRTALGQRVASVSGSRVLVLEDFTHDQILEFLTNLYSGDTRAAEARFALLADIEDLLGLARNPRMLAFIAGLDEGRLREVQQRHGRISAADLYRELVDFWLVGEADRQRHRHGMPTLDEEERLAACVKLAERLWASTKSTIPMSDLSADVSATLTRLAERGYTADQAAHAIGSGSLLVRTEEGTFTFVHQSIMEWLVADAAATALRENRFPDALSTRRLSQLMVDFFVDLAGADAVRVWADGVLAGVTSAEVARQNAFAVSRRIGPVGDQARNLAGVDLRTQDLSGRGLRGADLRGAVARGAMLILPELSGADLRDADFTGARLIGGSLRDARLDGSHWRYAAILGTDGADAPELADAAIPGRDPASAQMAAGSAAACVAFSPDGRLLAVAREVAVEIVDLQRGESVRLLTGHTGLVTAVAYSPDGTQLATASDDHTTRIWDTTTGEHRTTLTGHTGPIRAVAYSPDSIHLATASHDHNVRIWDATTGEHRTTLTGHTDWVTAIAYSPDGTHLAAASADHTTGIWDTATGEHRTTLTGHTDWVTAVAYSPDGTHLATAGHDQTIRIWDAATGREIAALIGLAYGGYAVLLPDGSYKLEGDPGNTLWWAVKLCRFAPGELDQYVPGLRRLPAGTPLRSQAAIGGPQSMTTPRGSGR